MDRLRLSAVQWDMSPSTHEMCSHTTGLQSHTTMSQHSHCQQPTYSALNIPSFKAELCLETLNVSFSNLCMFHCPKKHFPCGLFAPMALTPFKYTTMSCFLYILRVVAKLCFYCLIVKPQPFQKCSLLACSFGAHMCSEQLSMAWMIWRERKTTNTPFLTSDVRITN